MWIRMPQLPTKFYKLIVIKKAANRIGPLLRLDNFTAAGTRANFARMCVQVNLDHPLLGAIWIGDWKQKIQYEGVHTLCFNCGMVGHRKENCPSTQIASEPMAMESAPATSSPPDPNVIQGDKPVEKGTIESERGPWMLVSYRKSKGQLTNQAVSANKERPSGHWRWGANDISIHYPDIPPQRTFFQNAMDTPTPDGDQISGPYSSPMANPPCSDPMDPTVSENQADHSEAHMILDEAQTRPNPPPNAETSTLPKDLPPSKVVSSQTSITERVFKGLITLRDSFPSSKDKKSSVVSKQSNPNGGSKPSLMAHRQPRK